MINYNIGDLVTRINNSFKAGKGELMVPFSKENYQILTQLTKLGVIVSCTTNNTLLNPHQTIKVVLKDKNSNFNLASLPYGQELSDSEKNFFNLCVPKAYKQELNLASLSLKDKLYNMENGQEKTNIWFSESLQTHSSAPIGKFVLNPKKSLTLVSKPGKRIYISYKDLCNFNNGFKTYLLRTSKGIITSQTALKKKIGGELLIKLSLV